MVNNDNNKNHAMALAIVGLVFKDEDLEVVIKIVREVDQLGGQFSLKHAASIMADAERKFKYKEVIPAKVTTEEKPKVPELKTEALQSRLGDLRNTDYYVPLNTKISEIYKSYSIAFMSAASLRIVQDTFEELGDLDAAFYTNKLRAYRGVGAKVHRDIMKFLIMLKVKSDDIGKES